MKILILILVAMAVLIVLRFIPRFLVCVMELVVHKGVVDPFKPHKIEKRENTLTDREFREAVAEVIHYHENIFPRCHFELQISSDFSGINQEFAIIVYWMIKEALDNVVRHSMATQAHVYLQCSDLDHILHINITDNGNGFDLDGTEWGEGLKGMQERADDNDGALNIQSNDQGTSITLELPIKRAAESESE